MTTRRIGNYDHNDQCIGCWAHIAGPCDHDCPLQTGGEIRPAVVLRAAVKVLPHYPCGSGYDVPAAIAGVVNAFAPQVRVNGGNCLELGTQTVRALADYLRDQWGSPLSLGTEAIVRGLGEHSILPLIGRALYAASARHEGIEFDPDDFGTRPA